MLIGPLVQRLLRQSVPRNDTGISQCHSHALPKKGGSRSYGYVVPGSLLSQGDMGRGRDDTGQVWDLTLTLRIHGFGGSTCACKNTIRVIESLHLNLMSY